MVEKTRRWLSLTGASPTCRALPSPKFSLPGQPLLVGAMLLSSVAAEPTVSAETCTTEATAASGLPRMRFCSFVEPTVVGIMLAVTIVQSMFIVYLLLAKRIHGYSGRKTDKATRAESRSLEEAVAADEGRRQGGVLTD